MRRAVTAALAALAAGCAAGGGGEDASVSGTVTFKGQPVPRGRVTFSPDPAKNPGGQQGYADIAGGRYDTAAGGRPPSAGAVVVRVEGLTPLAADGTGAPLFQTYEVPAELPAGRSHKDIEVPASAGAKLPKNAGPPP
jgi:hypothetical protein